LISSFNYKIIFWRQYDIIALSIKKIGLLPVGIGFRSIDAGIAKHELKLTITLNEHNRSTIFAIYSYLSGIERFSDPIPREGGDKPHHYKRSFIEQIGVRTGV